MPDASLFIFYASVRANIKTPDYPVAVAVYQRTYSQGVYALQFYRFALFLVSVIIEASTDIALLYSQMLGLQDGCGT